MPLAAPLFLRLPAPLVDSGRFRQFHRLALASAPGFTFFGGRLFAHRANRGALFKQLDFLPTDRAISHRLAWPNGPCSRRMRNRSRNIFAVGNVRFFRRGFRFMLTAVPDFAVATDPDRSPFAGNCASNRSKAAIAVSIQGKPGEPEVLFRPGCTQPDGCDDPQHGRPRRSMRLWPPALWD